MWNIFKDLARSLEVLERTTFALVCFGIAFVISLFLGVAIFGSFGWGVIIWCALMAMYIEKFMVSVPEVTGLMTINLLTGQLPIHGTGVHFIYPWEQVKKGNFINLRIITESMEETYPSLDGSLMMVKWSFQYKPLLELLPLYIESDDNTIRKGLRDVGSSVLSANIGGTPAKDCKKKQQDLETELWKEFQKLKPTPDELYGIELIRTSLADVDYEERVQRIMATKQISDAVQEIAEKIKIARPTISDKDAMNAAMILNGNITKSVTEVEGEGLHAVAGILIAMAKAKGDK